MKALAAEATVRADSMSAVSLLAARLLRNLVDTVVKDGDCDPDIVNFFQIYIFRM